MIWTFADAVGPLIAPHDDVTVGDIQYPRCRDKSTISGLVEVVETAPPDLRLYEVTGSHAEVVGGVPTQIWDAVPRPLGTAAATLIAVDKGEAGQRIRAAVPEYKQANAALGLYDQAETDAIRAVIQAHRAAQQVREDAITAAIAQPGATVDDLAAVPPVVWPYE